MMGVNKIWALAIWKVIETHNIFVYFNSDNISHGIYHHGQGRIVSYFKTKYLPSPLFKYSFKLKECLKNLLY